MTEILTHVDAGVTTLTINRAEKKNSLTAAMYAALAQGIAQAAQDDSQRVLVIQGHETVFSAGNDVADFLHQPPTGADAPVFHFLKGIATFPKPLLAAVCGPAVGVGTTMLLHCDLVYVSDEARLAMPFASLGLVPEFASSLILPQLVGQARAAEKLLLGDPFTAEEAVEMRIANAVLPAGEVLRHARRMAERFNTLPPGAVRDSKQLLRRASVERVLETINAEAIIFGQRLSSPEATEAFSAFFQKRKPDFSSFS